MGVNKVELANGETLVDLTRNTVNPDVLLEGYTATNAQGEQIEGRAILEGGGSGGGIIDVTELPTENIDENAVYRVTENIQVEKNEIYIRKGGSAVTLSQYLASLGISTIPNIYVVDELPSDMKVSDVQTFSELHFYILKSDGIAYMNVPAYGGIIAVGLFGFQAMGYDKGFTENINAETEDGVYTTLEAYKQVVRWFTRENGEWKEITAHINSTLPNGYTDVDVLSGAYTITGGIEITQSGVDINVYDMLIDDKSVPSTIKVNTPSTGDLIQGSVNEIAEVYFRSSDGSYIDSIDMYAFYYKNIEKVELPEGISKINGYAFANCRFLRQIQIPKSVEVIRSNCFCDSGLMSVTFKGTPSILGPNAFYGCFYLTTINAPWSEGEVAGAPWSATNATINYNYTGE